MAKYVLVAFESDSDADKFVAAAKVYAADEKTNMSEVFGYVSAVYKKPTKFCECKGHSGPYTRGKKYGWWVHARKGCGKPTRWWADGQHWFVVLGNNLLAAAGRERHLLPEVGASAEQASNTETTGLREG